MRPLPKSDRDPESPGPGGRISLELESLRQKISDLVSLEQDLTEAEFVLSTAKTASGATSRKVEQIKADIENRLGFFPPLFLPALDVPEVLEGLWRQSLSAFYDCPLPALFKEKLAASLGRYCTKPYPIVVHSCALRALGMGADQIAGLLGKPLALGSADAERLAGIIAGTIHPLDFWPPPDSDLEEILLESCILLYRMPESTQGLKIELCRLLGPKDYARVIALFSYIRSVHQWVEGHPTISCEDHPAVQQHLLPMLKQEPRLTDIFKNHYRKPGPDLTPVEAGKSLQASEERYRELFENANDIVYTHDLDGNLTSLNRAAERIIGYPRSEALGMKFTDLVAPEYLETARKMIDPQVAREIPVTYDLEIVSGDGHRVALGISTRPIFREGKAVAIQGIARDITEHRRTDAALQQANQKLAAWVSELEQRTREMTLLNDMGDMLRACLSTEEAYDVIVRVAQQIFPAQVGALYVITSSRNLVEAVAIWGDEVRSERVFSPNECWGLRRGRIHWVEDSQGGLICKHLHQPAPMGYVCIPMMAQSEALGILHLAQPENIKMTESMQRLAVTMSEHIAMALSNLRLHETLRSQSIRDPLTGLFNRRFMEESLELEVRRASRNQRPLGVIMIDLDHFKHFNDTFRHEAGDTLLKELGTLLQTNIRGEDIACRYGGEEFTLILPEGSQEITRQRAEFLREAIKRLDIRHRNEPLGRITASMGVAVFPDNGRTGKALLEAADLALYRSKDAGRDCVTMASTSP